MRLPLVVVIPIHHVLLRLKRDIQRTTFSESPAALAGGARNNCTQSSRSQFRNTQHFPTLAPEARPSFARRRSSSGWMQRNAVGFVERERSRGRSRSCASLACGMSASCRLLRALAINSWQSALRRGQEIVEPRETLPRVFPRDRAIDRSMQGRYGTGRREGCFENTVRHRRAIVARARVLLAVRHSCGAWMSTVVRASLR